MNDPTMLDERSCYHRAPEVIERDVGDEVVGDEVVLAVPGSKDVAVDAEGMPEELVGRGLVEAVSDGGD